MVEVIDAEHGRAAAKFRRLWSAYEENRDLMMMGAYAAGNDLALDEAVALRPAMLNFIQQDAHENVAFGSARGALLEGFGQ